MSFLAAAMLTVSPAGAEAVEQVSHLFRMCSVLESVRADIPVMKAPAEQAAARLAEGGSLYAAGQASLVSELCGRAGGLMLTKRLGKGSPVAGDVVLWGETEATPLPAQLAESGALVVVFGDGATSAPLDEDGSVWRFSNRSREAGVSTTLANAVPAWVFTAELVAALTRLVKMPVLYESIGAYGGYPRIEQYKKKGVLWHETHGVGPVAAGQLGGAYVAALQDILRRVACEEADDLARVAGWIREAKGDGKHVIMYSMGHLFPAEVKDTRIGEDFESGVWQSGFLHHEVPDDPYGPGDVLVHIGYQHPPYRLFGKAREAGARVAYVDLYRHRDYVDDEGVVWIDPMWPWFDGCVDVDGYDIPILPASGVVNGAIAWEIHRLSGAAK